MDWDFLLEVWHESMAQLLSDGVSRCKIPTRGVNDVLAIWGNTREGAEIYDCLPSWKYDPALDGSDSTAKTQIYGDTGKGWGIPRNLDLEDSDTSEQDICISDAADDQDESSSNIRFSQDSGEDYVWPCGERRLEILRYRDILQNPDFDMNTDNSSSESKIQITIGVRVCPLMAQHFTSSFRVLVRHMRDLHRAVFAGDNATLNHFWEQLFIVMGPDEWGNPTPNSPLGLKQRFGWVYEYVLTGQMPVKVLRLMDALRQIWNGDGTVLRISTHPYTLKAECATSSLMNPDLCPRWVAWIMMKNNAMAKILRWLPDRYGVEISEKQMSSSYGILIPVLWEEAYRLQLLKNVDGSADEGSSNHHHCRTSNSDNTTGFHEAGKTEVAEEKPIIIHTESEQPADIELQDSMLEENDGQPVEIESYQSGDGEFDSNPANKTIEDLISSSYFSGNVSTWAWLHLRHPRKLLRGGNHILADAISRLDPKFTQGEWLLRVRMRKHLKIKDLVEDEQFSHHGRLIPKRLNRRGCPRLRLFQSDGTESKPNWDLGRKASETLENTEDDEGLFVWFDESEINFRARNGSLLHSLHVSEMKGPLLEYFNRERCLQLKPDQNTSLSELSEDARPGDLKKGIAPSVKPPKSRQGTRPGGDIWSTEEVEWLYDKLYIEQLSDFHSLAEALKERFGVDRGAVCVRDFARQGLHWTSRKQPPQTWHPSGVQAY